MFLRLCENNGRGNQWITYTYSYDLINHASDVIMSTMASQITDISMLCSSVCSGAYQRTHQSSASLAFERGIQRWPVISPHKWRVTRKMFLLDDVIMRGAGDVILWNIDKIGGYQITTKQKYIYIYKPRPPRALFMGYIYTHTHTHIYIYIYIYIYCTVIYAYLLLKCHF